MRGILRNLMILALAALFIQSGWAQTPPPPEEEESVQEGLVPEEAAEPAGEAKEEAPPEKKFRVAPSILIKPAGADRDVTSKKHGFWFGVEPSIAFGLEIPTATDRILNFSAQYTFMYWQYFNLGQEKKLEHDVALGLSHSLTDRLSASVNAGFYYWQFYLLEHQTVNEFDVELVPVLSYKLTDKLSLGLGYYFLMFVNPNDIVAWDDIDALSSPPSDPGDYTSGMYDYYNYTGYAYTPPDGESTRFYLHGLQLNVGYKFTPTTSGSIKYKYYPYVYSNVDALDHHGHELWVTASQGVWKGGNLTVIWRPRRQTFRYVFTDLGNRKIAYRHRVYVLFSQRINDYVSLDNYYRLQYVRSNMSDPNISHQFHLGINLSF